MGFPHHPLDVSASEPVRRETPVRPTATTRPDAPVRTAPAPVTSDGDHERLAHYVKKSDIVRSNIDGVEVEALCGKRWIPNRDPERYPVCQTCKEILAKLRDG